MFDGSPPEGPGGEAAPKRGPVRAAHIWYGFLAGVLLILLGAMILW